MNARRTFLLLSILATGALSVGCVDFVREGAISGLQSIVETAIVSAFGLLGIGLDVLVPALLNLLAPS